MKFTNVRDLKAKTSDILKYVDSGGNVVVTYHGKPKAIISKITESDIKIIKKTGSEGKLSKDHPFMRLIGIISDEAVDVSENKYSYIANTILSSK